MAQTLEEYLTSLGFTVDQASYAKFLAAAGQAALSAAKIGTSATAAATTVAIAVARVADEYTKLHFITQRLGDTTIGQLKGFEYGVARIGGTYESARAAAESFAAASRMNPGLQGLLRTMGIGQGSPVDQTTQLVGRLKAQFGEGGYFIAARIAQLYGVEEQTFQQMWKHYNDLIAQQKRYAAQLRESGVNMDELGYKSKNFTRAQDDLLVSLNMILLQTGTKWLPTMTSGLRLLDDWSRVLVRLGRDTNGWTSTVISLVAALGGLKAVAWIMRMIPGLRTVGAGLAGATSAGVGVLPHVVAGAGLMAVAEAASQNPEAKNVTLNKENPLIALRQMFRLAKPKLQEWLGITPAGAEKGAQQQVIDYFVSQGWTREQAVGMAASLHGESKFDPKAFNPRGGGQGAHGIAQWRGDRLKMFEKLYGKPLAEATLAEQLEFHQWELTNTERDTGDAIRNARTPAEAAALHSRLFERHGVPGEDARRGALADQWFATGGPGPAPGGNVTINQKTDVHVSSTDPKAAASGVVDAQDRVNGDLVRNTRAAVR